MTNSHFDEVCKRHHQKAGNFCAVSAFEFASKMFGIISLDSFPLQSDSTNEGKGFDGVRGEHVLLASVGLQGDDESCDVNAALIELDDRTNPGDFHAVSLYNFQAGGYHIYVATKLNNNLVLVDPSYGKITANGTCEVERELQKQLKNKKDEAKQIDILWLSMKAGDR